MELGEKLLFGLGCATAILKVCPDSAIGKFSNNLFTDKAQFGEIVVENREITA